MENNMADGVDFPEEENGIHAPPNSYLSPPSSPTSTPSTKTSADSLHIQSASFTYTPFYCEENVYFLCKKLSMTGVADSKGLDLFVVFISNEEKKVPLWYQKASKGTDGLVIWDYHVICIQVMAQKEKTQGYDEANADHLLWDLDSILPFPLPLSQYMATAIQPLRLNSIYSRLFRVVHAPIFLRYFASNRRHMMDPLGKWISLPPPYKSIVAEDGSVNNLNEYIQMQAADVPKSVVGLTDSLHSERLGVVVSEKMLEGLFSQIVRSISGGVATST